ncbi:MAG: hypothetical protein DMD64_08225 [Gemmatimonadetes bacterium]|nr:MAG: hypothetical protein DMD64_08225 [Gemmatimonadota bacterium]
MTARLRRAPLHATAAFSASPPFDHDRDLLDASFGDAAIQSGPPLGPYPALHLMAAGLVRTGGTRRTRRT